MAVYALLIDTLMLPINAPSILTLALRWPPASTTAMSTGYPISTAFASAAEITPFLRLLALCSPCSSFELVPSDRLEGRYSRTTMPFVNLGLEVIGNQFKASGSTTWIVPTGVRQRPAARLARPCFSFLARQEGYQTPASTHRRRPAGG